MQPNTDVVETTDGSEEQAQVAPDEQPGQEPEDSTQEEVTEDESTDEDESTEDVSALPDWAQTEITRLRRENARRRTALREAEERLKNAKTEEDMAAAIAEWEAKASKLESELVRERVLRQVPLPDTLAARLQGETEEELLADAKSLAGLVRPRPPAPDPAGGLDPTTPPDDEIDPVEAARKARAARKGYAHY